MFDFFKSFKFVLINYFFVSADESSAGGSPSGLKASRDTVGDCKDAEKNKHMSMFIV